MKNIQVGSDPECRPGPMSTDGQSMAGPQRCAAELKFRNFSGPLFLSGNEGVLPSDLRSLHCKPCNPKYILVSITTHLPFGEPY